MSALTPDLNAALARFEARISEPTLFGTNDCCVAVADVLAAAWGADPMARFRGRYATRRGFMRLIAKAGCRTLAEAMEVGAADAGARPASGSPRDFDLGIIGVQVDGETVGLPAFHLGGWWRGRLETGGMAATRGAFKVWRPAAARRARQAVPRIPLAESEAA